MKLYKKLFSRWTGVAMLATMGLFACQPEIDAPAPTSGSANFTTYVALGNSLTAGYADGGVYRESQVNSYPEMIAKSMQEAGGAQGFKTPLMPEGNGSGYLQLQVVNGSPSPVPVAADPSAFASVASGGPYQNLGVPGARVADLTRQGYGSAQGNPYYTRFATSPGTTIVADAVAQNPTFFTLWIGNNDVLGYATSGGDQGGDRITPKAEFETEYNEIIAELDGASGGALVNIPNILAAPYFQYVRWDGFPLTEEQAAALNAGLRANLEAGVRPLVVAGVREQVRLQVTAGAIETVIRPRVLTEIRAFVTSQVRAGAIAQAIAQGATQAQAEALADNFIASEEGQARIDAEYEAFIGSEAGQARIQQEIDGALALPSTQALIDAQTDQQMQSEAVQAIIQENLDAQVTAILSGLGFPVSAGNNAFLIQGERTQANPTGLRRATSEDLILLTAGSFLSAEAAAGRPPILTERYVLDATEQAKVTAAVNDYNAVIQAAAGSKYAYVNINDFFEEVISGFSYQGVGYSPTFITGGAFSLDGIHLTQRGYALAGNEIIKAINSKYNAKLSLINVNDYRGILFP